MTNTDGPYERKVQLTGGTTYTVSLPKAWATSHSIGIGDPVTLHTRGARLIVSKPADSADRRAVTITSTQYGPSGLARVVTAACLAGAEVIRIEDATTREGRTAVLNAISGLVGVEIDEETTDSIVARTMLNVDDLSPTRTLHQMENTALRMHAEAIEAALAGDADSGIRIQERDETVNRLFGLLAREFQRSLVDVRVGDADTALTTFDYYTAGRQLERVGDHASKIAGTAELFETAPPDDVVTELTQRAEDARTVVERAIVALLGERDPGTLEAIQYEADDVVEDVATLHRALAERDVENGYALATVLDSITRTAEYGANIADAGLQAALRGHVGGRLRKRTLRTDSG